MDTLVPMPYLNLNEALVQKFPTFRVMLPNNVAIVIEHHDSDDLHKCLTIYPDAFHFFGFQQKLLLPAPYSMLKVYEGC